MNRQKGWRAGLAAGAVLVVLAGQARAQVKPAAMVNGEPIMLSEVEMLLKNQPPSAKPLTEAQRRFAQREALDFLINDMVMKQFLQRQFASKPGFGPNAPEVNKQIGVLVSSLDKKKMTLAKFLQDSGQTEAQLRAHIVKGLQWDAYADKQISDAYLKKYYEAYKPFFDKVTVRASHILIRVPEGAKEADRQAARNKLLALRQEIVSGKIDFAEAARKYSECTSRTDGGDIGSFPRKFIVQEPFANAAFAMKVGEVSNLVETDIGMHLIKVTERSPGEPSDFEKIKDYVRKICKVEMASLILEREHKASKIVINLQ
jgi:peptidyl-prolyl cis-trans isomerase C